MASQKSRSKRGIMDVISFTIPGRDTYQMTVKEIVSKIEKDRTENMDEAVQTLIAVWTTISCRTENLSNVADIFHSLFRKTSLTILSVRWIKVTSAQKRQMAKVLTKCSQVFGPLVEKATRLCTVLVMAVYDPWGEPALNQLVEGQIDFTDASVREFISSEPEELLLTRVESLTEAGHVNAAIQLCKSCLKHCTAIMAKSEQNIHSLKKREKNKALPFIENMLILLHNQGEYAEVIKEASKLKCHDGVNLIEEISSKCLPGNASLPEMLSHLFLARDINLPSTYCCTKDLMNLWCKLQLTQQRSVQDICNSAQRLICHAPSSAYFYLFVDRLWHQFGDSLLPLYLEMYVRGLTSDMNFLDVVRVAGPPEKVMEMEAHLAFIFTKLSSLFSGIYNEIALECLLTAYSFLPAKEKLDKIHKMKERLSKRMNSAVKPINRCVGMGNTDNFTEKCTCEGRCSTPTKDNQNLSSLERARPVYKYHLPHLVLDGEIKGVPYFLLEDFVSILECMRYRHLRASDDWETLKRNCLQYLEKYTARKATEPSNDSADSEMDSVSDEGDDNTPEIKIPRINELPREQGIAVRPLSGKFKKDFKAKNHRKQKYSGEDSLFLESQDTSMLLSAYSDADKEVRKRKKKRKTKREKDREAISRKDFEEYNKATLVLNKITDDSRKQSKYPLQSSSGIKNEFTNLSSQAVRGLMDEGSPLLCGNVQNKNLVVVLSDILSDNIVDLSKSDGICKNVLQHCSEAISQSGAKKQASTKESERSYDTVCSPYKSMQHPQEMLDRMMDNNTKSNNKLVTLLPSTPISSEHVELPVAEQNSSVIKEHKTVVVTCEKPSVTNMELENHSVSTVRPDAVESSANFTTDCISEEKGMNENEQEKKQDDPLTKPAVQVICTTANSNCTVTPIPLDSLPKKLQVQIERKGGIPSISSMATLSIPLPVGVKHNGGNKVLSGRLVIPVNRLQRAVASSTNTTIKIEGDATSSKQQMLSIPNVILMKRNINNDEETGSKKANMNKGSKNQKRTWATVRNLHGSIEWRKVSEDDGSIPFQQKPICAAKLRSGGVALSGPLFVSPGKGEDKSDLPVTANISSSPSLYAATTVTNSSTSVPLPSSTIPGNLHSTVTDTMSSRNDSRIVQLPSDANVPSTFATAASVADFSTVQSIPLVTQVPSTKPVIIRQDHEMKFISGIDSMCSTNATCVSPVITRTTVLKDSSQSTSPTTVEKGCARNIIRLTPCGAGTCKNNSDFSLSSSVVSGINSCPQVTKFNSNIPQTDPDLPVNLSVPKKSPVVSVDTNQCTVTPDSRQHTLHQAQMVTSSCKTDLGLSSVEHNISITKASSTLQMLLASSTASGTEQRKCNEFTSVNTVSSTGAQNNIMNKSVNFTPSSMSANLPLDFKKAYPTTNMNCFVGLSPLNSPSNEAKLSAIVANNTSRIKKERLQKVPLKDDSHRTAEQDNKEPFDVIKLIGHIRELANAEAEKAAKAKEKCKSQKDAKCDNKNRKLSKKSFDPNVKLDPLVPVKKYNCVLCPSSLTQKYGLRRHYRDVHGMEVRAEQSSESILKQFNDINSNPDGTFLVRGMKRNKIKAIPRKNVASGSLFPSADTAENQVQKAHQILPGMDVAFPHLNIFHQASSHASSMPLQRNTVPAFPPLSAGSYYPQPCINSSALNWNDNNQAIVPAEKTLEAMILDAGFYNEKVSDKPLPELGDCRQVLNESKQTFSTSDMPLTIPSSFCTDDIGIKNTHPEHKTLSVVDANKNIKSDLLTAISSKNLPVVNCEKLEDADRNYKISTSEKRIDTDKKLDVHTTKEWSKELKQISVSCVKLDSVYSQPMSSFGNVNPVDTTSSLTQLETDYFSSYHNKKHGERTIDGSLDNAVDSEVSELVAFMLHIGNKPYGQQASLDSDGEVKDDDQYKQDKNGDDNKSESLKSVRQRTRIRHSPNSSLKRSCPCCRDSEASLSAKRCRNLPNISKMTRPPTVPWLSIERTNVQQRRSRKSLPPITRSSKRLRTRSSTTSLT